MSTKRGQKINQLLQSQPTGVVFLSSWLARQGYSLDLQQRYKNSGWLESIGFGAMIRSGDEVGYQGALYTLQRQKHAKIHIGGRTAFSLLGKTQYLDLAVKRIVVFSEENEKLPKWFSSHDWGVEINHYNTSFLPQDVGLVDIPHQSFTYSISGAERAMMQCLYLAPKQQDLIECYEVMEGLNNLRPRVVQELLEHCKSIKVKRLFLYLAEKADHPWLRYLNTDQVDLGSGKRSVVPGGKYISKYQISVPKELDVYDR